MKIFLDTKDLINLFQKSPRTSVDDFISKLWDGDHKLVFSVLTIMEYSNQKSGGGEDKEEQIKNIFQILEPAPKEYIEVPILKYEIKKAFNAFFDKRPYKGLSPFKDQFDKVLRNEKDWGRYNSYNRSKPIFS